MRFISKSQEASNKQKKAFTLSCAQESQQQKTFKKKKKTDESK